MRILTAALLVLSLCLPVVGAEGPVGSGFKVVKEKDNSDAFKPDPKFDKHTFNTARETYWKQRVANQRPLLEIGRDLYQYGPLQRGSSFPFGKDNPTTPQFMIFGDAKIISSFNSNNGIDQGQIVPQLNLDFDLKLTATERVHVFIQPLQDRNGNFIQYQFGEENGFDDGDFGIEFLDPEAAFFEGNLTNILHGFTGIEPSVEIPFTVGIIPLLFHNGIWVEDAFTGAAITLPAVSNADFLISNMDVTFFVGFDRVTSDSVAGTDSQVNIFGVNAFIEAMDGYWEVGYGFLDDNTNDFGDASHHNVAISYTRRYSGIPVVGVVSNSTRFLAGFGQGDGVEEETDGILILSENAFLTGKPQNIVPYANFFAGFGRYNPLAKNNGGALRNTGINFETDGLGFPKLADTGEDSVGAALGVNLLFDNYNPFDLSTTQGIFSKQLVLEYAIEHFHEDGLTDHAFGLRYQHPLSNSWIFRFDTTYQILESAEDDAFGVRFELRKKF